MPMSAAMPMSTSLMENLTSEEQILMSVQQAMSIASPNAYPCNTQITAVLSRQHECCRRSPETDSRFSHFSILDIQS